MTPNKVCSVGARTAITNYFVDKGAINNENQITSYNKLLMAHDRLKVMLKNTYGIDRNIIIPNSKSPVIQFVEGVLDEIDALSGNYYILDKTYSRDVNNDSTLSPIEIVNKYIVRTDDPVGLSVVPYKQWTLDELGKFKSGMQRLYPEIQVVAVEGKMVGGKPRFMVDLVPIKEPIAKPLMNDDPVVGNEEYVTREMEIVTAALNPLMKKFKNVKVNWVTQKELVDMLKGQKPKVIATKGADITAVAVKNNVYLVKGKVTMESAIEEFMHMFVDTLAVQRKALYLGLLRQAKENYPMLAAKVSMDYSDDNGFDQEDRNREIVTKALRDAYIQEREERPQGVALNDFIKLAKEFFKWVGERIASALGLSIETLPMNATIAEVATYLNVDGIELPYVEATDVRFNVEPGEGIPGEFDDERILEDEAKINKTSIQQIKIDRANDQLARIRKTWEMLNKRNDPSTKKIRETLTQLGNHTKNFIDNILKNDVRTVSVTKFAGSPIFDPKFKARAEASIGYGVFQHTFLETLMFSALDANMSIGDFVRENPDFFDQIYNSEIEIDGKTTTLAKHYLKHEGVTQAKIKRDVMKLVDILIGDSAKGILLPEITVYGYDNNGKVVQGRLDYIIITKDGKIKVKDLKTHRSKGYIKGYTDAPLNESHPSKRLEDGVHPLFEVIPNRTKYSDYLSQISIYSRILKQNGFEESESPSIISMIYYPNKEKLMDYEEWFYEGAYVQEVSVEGSMGMMRARDKNGQPTADIDPRYEEILKTIVRAIPVKGEEETAEEVVEETINNFQSSFEKMDTATIETMVKDIGSLIQKQLEQVRKQISDAKTLRADEKKLRTLKERRDLLNDANQWFIMERNSAKYGEVKPEVVLKVAIEKSIESVTKLKQESEAIEKDDSLKSEEKLKELITRNSQLADFYSFFDSFSKLLLSNGIQSDTHLGKTIIEAKEKAHEGQQPYIRLAGEQTTQLLLKVNRKLAERMMESMRLYLGFRKQKLEKIVAGDNSVLSNGVLWLSGKINKVIGNAFSKAGETPTVTQDMKDAAAKELKQIEFWEKNQVYDRNFVELYINNTFKDPESGFYIGSTITPRGGTAMNSDDFVASFSNSELAIAAMASYGINMTENARVEFFDQMEKLSIEQVIGGMSAKFGGYEAAIAAISQEVKIKDLRTDVENNYRMFLTPEDMTYYSNYNAYDYALLTLKQQIEDAKVDANLSEEERKTKIADLKAKRNEAYLAQKNWLIAEASNKFKDDVYKLEIQLPVDIQEEIDALRKSIVDLKNAAASDDVGYTDSTVDEIQEKEFRISKLRKEAILNNPELKDIFDKYNKYYKYDINWSGWQYQRDWHKKKFGENSAAFKAWDKMNTDYIPMSSWHEKVNSLLDEKREIWGAGDARLDALYNQRKDLMKKYNFKSDYSYMPVFNPLFMSEEDYQELVDIEDAIENFKPASRSAKPTKDQFNRLQEIDEELARIRARENKQSYVMEFIDYKDKLTALLQQMNEIKNDPKQQDKYNQLTTQFLNQERDFKKWYDRNNISEYVLGTLQKQGSVSMDPRRFNQVYMPKDKSMMIQVPTARWKIRTETEEAFNPDYSPSIMKRTYGSGSYAMPKGIKYVKDKDGLGKGRYEVDPKSKWANPRYVALMNDPKAMGYYNQMVMDLYVNKQIDMSAQKLGHFYPSVTQPGFDSVAQEGWDGLKREWRELAQSIKLYDSDLERDTNEYGLLSNTRIRFPHNSLWTADLTTKDGLNAILKWNLSYEINKSMEEANLIMSPAIDFLKYKKAEITQNEQNDVVIKQLEKVIDIWEFERNKFVYGQTVELPPGGVKSNLFNRKMLKNLMSVVSFSRLGFEPIMQVGNLVSGNVQAYMAGEIAQNGVGGTKDLAWAKAQMYNVGGFFYKVIENWGELSGLNLQSKILRFFNPSMKDYDKQLDITGRGKTRRLLVRGFNLKDLAYIIQDKGEMEIAITTLLKNLHAHKYNVYATDAAGNIILDENGNRSYLKDENGEIVQVHAYEALVDGPGIIPGIRPDVDMTMDDLEAIRMTTYNEYLKFQGNYSQYMKPKAESSIIGVLMTFYRKYLVPAVENRFKGAFGVGDPKNWTSGRVQVGWWTAMAEIFKYGERGAGLQALLPGFVSKALGMDKLGLFHRSKAMQARREVMVAIILTMAYATLRSIVYGDDDEKEEVNWAGLQSMRVFAKVANESRSLVWIPVIGKADDYVTNFSTFTTAFNEGKMLANLFTNTFWYTTAGVFDWEHAKEMAFYERKSGRFEKGDPKILANLLKLSGVENMLDVVEPIYAVKQMYRRKD